MCDKVAGSSPKGSRKGAMVIGVLHRGEIQEKEEHHRCCDGVLLFGAPSGIRTRDPLIKSQLLYQLS